MIVWGAMAKLCARFGVFCSCDTLWHDCASLRPPGAAQRACSETTSVPGLPDIQFVPKSSDR
eukprot:5361086-Lingulodinium_polyedra.AAC.1